MPQPANLDRISVHGCIADYRTSEFPPNSGKVYHLVRICTAFDDITCQIDPSINPSAPVVGTVGDFTIGIEYRVRPQFGREQVEAKRWLISY